MNPAPIIERLESFAPALHPLLRAITSDRARFKPPHPDYPAGAWSILEIVCHLADEERCDFRPRLRFALDAGPREAGEPPPIDPEGWAVQRRYNQRDLADAIADFERERAESIAWLRTLRDPDWSLSWVHPRAGPIRAGDVLAAWPSHDALHLRQLAKRLWELAARDGEPYSTAYAGEWRA